LLKVENLSVLARHALKEIVLANEIFKKTNPDSAEAFKDAHKNQSPLTKQIVTEAKSGA